MHIALPRISGGFINLTQRCNLACKYCFVCQQTKNSSLKLVKDAIDFFAKNAEIEGTRPSVTFFGGEPMLMYKPIIVPAVTYIRETYGDNYGLSITTNGTLLNKEVLDFFDANKISMLMSIDGDKETQDINRPYHGGKGSFDKLDKIIDLVLQYYPHMTFRATVDPPTHTRMYNNYLFAESKGYEHTFFIPNIFRDWSATEVAELEGEMDKIADHYIESYREGKRPLAFAAFETARNDIRRIQRLKETDFREDGKDLPGCGRCGLGGNRWASVGYTGNLYSCQEMVENPNVGDQFLIGNIYTGVDDDKRHEILSRFHTHNVVCSDRSLCDGCIKRRICDGGCTINNFFKHGDLNVQDALMCRWEQLAIKKMYRVAKTLLEEENPLFSRTW